MNGLKPIKKHVAISHPEISLKADDDLVAWLESHDFKAKWLLVHGVSDLIWGERHQDGWKLSVRMAARQTIPVGEVQQARAFNKDGELFVWRDHQGLRARLLQIGDPKAPELDGYMEEQWLWGTRNDAPDADETEFTLLADGVQGMRHAVPLQVPAEHFSNDARDHHRPVRLQVEHYLRRDSETGKAMVKYSRLSKLSSAAPQPKEATK